MLGFLCGNRSRSKATLPVIFLAIFFSYFLLKDSFGSLLSRHLWPLGNSRPSPTAYTNADFVDAFINATIINDFDGSALRKWCDAQTDWRYDIALDPVIFGGIGNVRNDVILTLRYAIEAGVSIIGPFIAKRDPDLIHIKTGNEANLDYLFDIELFQSRIKSVCPNLRFFESREEFEAQTTDPATIITSTPVTLPQNDGPVKSIKADVMERKGPVGGVTRVIFLTPFSYLPICVDGEEFANSIGQFIPFRPDVVRLAGACLHALLANHNLPIQPNNDFRANGFIGAHLRTAADAVAAGFPSYDLQAPRYLNISRESGVSILYLASGDLVSTERFKKEASSGQNPITVLTKHDLLQGAERQQMEDLNWDQQALIDYLVLLQSSFFVGLAASSFSANVAMRRRVDSRCGTCGICSGGDAPDATYRDEFTELVGTGHTLWAENLYP